MQSTNSTTGGTTAEAATRRNAGGSVEADQPEGAEVFVKECDVPERSSPISREDLVPFVARGFQAELASESASGSKVTDVIGRSGTMEADNPIAPPAVSWPAKYDVLGMEVTATTYDELVHLLVTAAHRTQPAVATFAPVHALVTGAFDPRYRYRVNAFDVVTPDGQPVRWALNALHRTGLPERVCGPETMIRVCRRAAEEGISIYLYGSTDDTLGRLKANLEIQCPGLKIVGVESPPFRPLSPEENTAVVERINDSGAGFVFIGLGCPRQDAFAYQNRNRINAVQLCVGAAFDFHAGKKKIAPVWMQKSGTEWIFRLLQEPGRLWKRYLVTNTAFVLLMSRRLITGR